MLETMARSTIKYLKKLGYSNVQIAEIVQNDPRTVARVLVEPTDKMPASRERLSSVAVFKEEIEKWFDQNLQVKRMLELAQQNHEHPYQGKPTAFYDYVRTLRLQRLTKGRQMAVRFEGLPGEFLQIDWGEIRKLKFTRVGAEPQTWYFFCARLKYSRFMFVSFQKDMVEETLVRCLIESFLLIRGVPWVCTTDNMKTVVLRRDEFNQPVWNPVWEKLAVEFGFHPEACAPASGNQKGAVENLVKFTENNFLAGRSFYDEADLDQQLKAWLHSVNYERVCQATENLPANLLLKEQAHLGKLPPNATDYGMFQSLVVNREATVTFQNNRYSVPSSLVGQTLTARIHRQRIRLYQGAAPVADHPRSFGRNQRVVEPEHYEKAFEIKPRARTMVYRDWLVKLSPVVHSYVAFLCQKQRATMAAQIQQLYTLARQVGEAEFVAAVELATEQQAYGVEYLTALTSNLKPAGSAPTTLNSIPVYSVRNGVSEPTPQAVTVDEASWWLSQLPGQAQVARPLDHYEILVANRHQLHFEFNETGEASIGANASSVAEGGR
jgi:transposase